MGQNVFSRFKFDCDRFHDAPAFRCAVARMYIDVLAEQALRAMVGVAVAMNARSTMFACEVFNGACEFFA